MQPNLDSDLEVELHDVFHVMQLTRDTALASVVAADLVDVEAHRESSVHRHNNAETILYFLDGSGDVLLTSERTPVSVKAGDRLHIAKGMYHAVRTAESPLRFLSVQSPPILDVVAGTRDLEPLEPDE